MVARDMRMIRVIRVSMLYRVIRVSRVIWDFEFLRVIKGY